MNLALLLLLFFLFIISYCCQRLKFKPIFPYLTHSYFQADIFCLITKSVLICQLIYLPFNINLNW